MWVSRFDLYIYIWVMQYIGSWHCNARCIDCRPICRRSCSYRNKRYCYNSRCRRCYNRPNRRCKHQRPRGNESSPKSSFGFHQVGKWKLLLKNCLHYTLQCAAGIKHADGVWGSEAAISWGATGIAAASVDVAENSNQGYIWTGYHHTYTYILTSIHIHVYVYMYVCM